MEITAKSRFEVGDWVWCEPLKSDEQSSRGKMAFKVTHVRYTGEKFQIGIHRTEYGEYSYYEDEARFSPAVVLLIPGDK